MTHRIAVPLFMAFLVTCGLFYLMQFLISSSQSAVDAVETLVLTEFVRVKEALVVDVKKPKPVQPPEPEVVPALPSVPLFNGGDAVHLQNTGLVPPTKIELTDGLGRADGTYLPIVKVQPVYPRRAQNRGLTGWVVVEFTVTKNGTVRDAYVVMNCAQGSGANGALCTEAPNAVFDRAALSAVSKFKYVPRVVDGEALESYGVQNKITFSLAGE
jgi:protein TonB